MCYASAANGGRAAIVRREVLENRRPIVASLRPRRAKASQQRKAAAVDGRRRRPLDRGRVNVLVADSLQGRQA